MAFKTSATTGGTFIKKDFMFVNSNNSFDNGYDNTTAPSNVNKITAYDGAAFDYYGFSVAVGSGRIVVGSYLDDDNGSSSGSAYVYDFDGNLVTKLTAFDAFGNDQYGYSVTVGSDRIVIGSRWDTNEKGSRAGSAYVYDLDGNLITKLIAYDGAADDYFGISVAVGSGRIVIGAEGDDDNGSSSGSAYVYDLDGNLVTKLTASDGAGSDLFGQAVAVGSGRIVVGAYGDDDNGSGSGSAYVYDLNGNLVTKLTAFDGAAGDFYGNAVAVGSDRIIVGAEGYSIYRGEVYVYDLNGNFIIRLRSPTPSSNDYYGSSVAVGSGRIVIGAYQDDDNVGNSGSVYIYDLDGNLITTLTSFDSALDDNYGISVSIKTGKIVVGAYRDDDNGDGSGSVYIYDTPKITHTLDILDD